MATCENYSVYSLQCKIKYTFSGEYFTVPTYFQRIFILEFVISEFHIAIIVIIFHYILQVLRNQSVINVTKSVIRLSSNLLTGTFGEFHIFIVMSKQSTETMTVVKWTPQRQTTFVECCVDELLQSFQGRQDPSQWFQ